MICILVLRTLLYTDINLLLSKNAWLNFIFGVSLIPFILETLIKSSWKTFDKEYPIVPNKLLSVSKLSAENYLKTYASHLGIKWNILRMFNIDIVLLSGYMSIVPKSLFEE